jgi:RimJ/RimL family protein N-acetyltransferase
MITGEKINLGPLTPTDFESLFRWSNDPAIAHFNEALRPSDWGTQHERWMNSGKDTSRVVFAIRKPTQPGIIGFVTIANIDPIHQAALIGITIGEPANRRQGFGAEAMRLAIDYCWNHLNISRIALTVFKHNTAAIQLYRQLGFKKEGEFRRALFIDGRWIDVLVMAILHPRRR